MEHITRQELYALLGCPLGSPTAPDAFSASAPEPNRTPLDMTQRSSEAAEPAALCSPDCAQATPEDPLPARSRAGLKPIGDEQRVESAAAQPALSNPPSALPPTPLRARNAAGHVRYLLATAVPRLWRYTLEKNPDLPARQQRSKLRELLAWLFTKEGYTVIPGARSPYRLHSELISGRIDLLIEYAGKPLLALETDWSREAASIAKLAYWHSQGVSAAWVLGKAAQADMLAWREFADRTFGGRTAGWLTLVTLHRPITASAGIQGASAPLSPTE